MLLQRLIPFDGARKQVYAKDCTGTTTGGKGGVDTGSALFN